jgi:hypothetical protein
MTGAYGYVRDGRHAARKKAVAGTLVTVENAAPWQRSMDCFASLAMTWIVLSPTCEAGKAGRDDRIRLSGVSCKRRRYFRFAIST